jgi:hypothetical protein
MNFFHERNLSQAASELVQFDADSIRHIVAAQHLSNPDVWLVDPDAYEKNGRVLRDSDSARMLAYSTKDRVLYATDGCNSCARQVQMSLERLSAQELKDLAEKNELRLELLEKLIDVLATNPG